MALGGEMHHGVRREALERFAHFGVVRDVGAHEGVARIVRHGRERVEIARIGELVDHQHLMRRLADDVAHDRRADEARAAGDEEALSHHAPSYLKGDLKSAKRPSVLSLSDSTASLRDRPVDPRASGRSR